MLLFFQKIINCNLSLIDIHWLFEGRKPGWLVVLLIFIFDRYNRYYNFKFKCTPLTELNCVSCSRV